MFEKELALTITTPFYQSITEDEHEPAPRVLVVDDELHNRQLFKRLLDYRFEVFEASDGKTALEILQEEHFDLVLLDVMMPFMSGLEVLELIRERFDYIELPVIIISAKNDEEDILRGLELGANDYLPKPVNMHIARARVKTQIQLKRINDKHKRVIDELQSAQTMQENFYRIVTHDLKGPLTNMRLAQTILRDMLDGDDQTNLILDNVDMTLDDMQEMIRMFLDVSALQNGALQTNIQCLATEDCIHGVIERIALIAHKKNIHIEASQLDGYLMGDARLLNQILTNLVTNALKFSKAGTSISLWAEHNTKWVTLHVADQGPGISASEQARLFQIFGTLSPRPTEGESSHGLGLWIVRQLVELQGGSVSYYTPESGGSVFYVKLPACQI